MGVPGEYETRITRSKPGRGWIFFVLMALACAPSGLAQGWLADPHVDVRNAVMPIYLTFQPEAAAVFRANHIFNDHQRRGFFRIGALPMLVIDGMSVEVRDPAGVSAALNKLGAQFAVKAGARKAVEGRDFRLTFAPEKDGCLRARRVRLENAAAWRLEDGALHPPGGPPVPFRQGTLTITGPQAGEFNYETAGGPARVQLLDLLSTEHH
jgi:hypothetical protein